jgi:hypothetical protein
MILKCKLSVLIITLLSFQTLASQPSINEMQTCQGLIDFVTLKLDNLPSKYDEDDVETVQNGLRTYNMYIQNTFVTPGLLKFSNGNVNKAVALQKQVDLYKEKVVKSYQNQYPYNKLSRGFVESLNKCTQKAVPSGNDLKTLKTSFIKILELINKQ